MMPERHAAIAVDVQNGSTVKSVPKELSIQSWIESAISSSGDTGAADCEISVRLVDEEEGRALNRQYRQQDKATNVLSFAGAGASEARLPPGVAQSLGDIVVCGPVVEREAIEQDKDVTNHWAHLLVHGTLHLLGFDHETDRDAALMEKLETEVLATHGIDDPYAERR